MEAKEAWARTDDEGHALHDVNSVDAAIDLIRPVQVRDVQPAVSRGVQVALQGISGVELEICAAGAAVREVARDITAGNGRVRDRPWLVVALTILWAA